MLSAWSMKKALAAGYTHIIAGGGGGTQLLILAEAMAHANTDASLVLDA